MLFKDYYKILDLPNNKVDKNQIKTAYREQAKKYHPDVNNSRNEERFKDINEAYRVLSDSVSKRKYDRIWFRNVGRLNASYEKNKRKKESLSDEIINIFFGSTSNFDDSNVRKEKAKKGDNIETEIKISIIEAYRGAEQVIGIKNSDEKVKKIKVKIPAGIRNNEKIKLVGQGKKGVSGGKNGDLFINVKIDDDERFSLDGDNLKENLYITPWEAMLSSKVIVEGLDEEISVYVPAGIQSGEKIEIEDKGYINNKTGKRGKLILEAKIMVPNNPTSEEIKLFEKLKNLSKFNPRNY